MLHGISHVVVFVALHSVSHAEALSLPFLLDGLVELLHHAHALPPEALEVDLPPFGLDELLEEEDVRLVRAHLPLQSFQSFPLREIRRMHVCVVVFLCASVCYVSLSPSTHQETLDIGTVYSTVLAFVEVKTSQRLVTRERSLSENLHHSP